MKILLLSFYYEPDLSAGSFRTTALVHSLLDQLSSDDHIDVITTRPNRYSSFSRVALELEMSPGLTINRINLPNHDSGMLDQSIAFVGYAKGVLSLSKNRNYDLVFATSSRLMTAVLGAYVSKRMRTRLYLDIRDIFTDTIKDVLPKKIALGMKQIFSVLESWAIREAFNVNLVSKGFLPYFKSLYPNQSLTIFTNGIDEEFVEAQPKNDGRNTSKVLNVVYAGNIGAGQGLQTIIPGLALRFVGRLQFKLIGDGSCKKELLSALAIAGINNVEILPPVNRSELIKIYKSADVLFLHLNDYDAFKKVLPSKIFEYGAIGKPIWAGVAGYAEDFINENLTNAAVFKPCNIDDAENSFERLEFVTRPRKNFVEKFARVNIMRKMAADIISVAEYNDHSTSKYGF